jgi:hypothetical protein
LVKIGIAIILVNKLIGAINTNNNYITIKEYHFPDGKNLAKFIIGSNPAN